MVYLSRNLLKAGVIGLLMVYYLQTPLSGGLAPGVFALIIVSSGILLVIWRLRRRPQIFIPQEMDSMGKTELDHKNHETHTRLEYIRAEGRYSTLYL